MDANFQDILDNLPTRVRGRSRLDPYGELVDELRRRGRTYRDVASILSDKTLRRRNSAALSENS